MVHHPIFRQINAMFSKFAFEHMMFQQMLSHQCKVMEFKRFNFSQKRLRDHKNPWTGEYIVREWIGQHVNFRVLVEFDGIPHHGPLIGVSHGHLPAYCQPELSQMLTGCQCDCHYFYSFNLICQHIFTVFNILQLKRLGHCYKLFSRWLRVSENDDYYNENI